MQPRRTLYALHPNLSVYFGNKMEFGWSTSEGMQDEDSLSIFTKTESKIFWLTPVKEVPVILLTEVKSRIPLPHPLFCPPT
jgi:hypothetical protein